MTKILKDAFFLRHTTQCISWRVSTCICKRSRWNIQNFFYIDIAIYIPGTLTSRCTNIRLCGSQGLIREFIDPNMFTISRVTLRHCHTKLGWAIMTPELESNQELTPHLANLESESELESTIFSLPTGVRGGVQIRKLACSLSNNRSRNQTEPPVFDQKKVGWHQPSQAFFWLHRI